MQNDNAICKMALHSVFKFTFYITFLATIGAKWKWNYIIYICHFIHYFNIHIETLYKWQNEKCC